MELKLAKRAQKLKASEIRELLKLTQKKGLISFAGGLPAPELFPIDEMKKVTEEIFTKYGKEVLQYSLTEGNEDLRTIIGETRMKNVKVPKENILITSGSQQGLDFTGKLFIDKGDKIICEKPTYLGALTAFNVYEPEYVEVEMDDYGMIIEDLEEKLKSNPEVKFIYTIPDFQNPTGRTLPVDRRKKMVEIAKKYEVLIIEDNPYGELRYEGERYPSIKSFDDDGYVIYLGTFSKIFCPGLRIGWICASDIIIEKYIMVKQSADLHCNTLAQQELVTFMKMFDIEEHIDQIKEVYRKRRNVMLEALEKYMPKDVKYVKTEGGLFIWLELKETIDTKVIFEEAVKRDVAFVPGHSFYAKDVRKNYMRLNYSSMSEDLIKEGIKRLSEVIMEYY
ncbi:PLP-dependent aminotransferase family protein [Clostridium grantii]|uniref:2-aminoadipate transaminase n=1 Tax=Clostridium grantii DSM 8605 TaxID=1121316 RepID=A0A1M5XQF2_9CLOT|nr:PLP-dependent aminotransferase family protein [Clostridium grantii]SHI02067.1 2-aminoadipate transaminase [Clostridium grantii DSM 8605]